MGEILIIGMGGFIGAILRYQISGYVQGFTKSDVFPYDTLAVNVLGSFVIGLMFYFVESRGTLDPQVRAFVLIGALGAFTTFSTFSIETLNFLLNGEIQWAIFNLTANCFLGLLAAWMGRMLPVLVWR